MKKITSVLITFILIVSYVLNAMIPVDAQASVGEKDAVITLEGMPIIDHGSYQENEGDSTIFNLNGKGLTMYDDGETFIRNGNVGVDGTSYYNGFEAWIARWNYCDEISWAYATFDIGGKYKTLTGKTNLIESYNTDNFDTTIYFYDGERLLESYNLTPSDYIKDIHVDVEGVNELKMLVQDNKAVSGGTSFALYDMFLDGEVESNTVRVKVNATERESGKIVPVENAEVHLYTDTGITTYPTNRYGIAEVSLEGLTDEQIKNATISASKVVSRGKAIDGSARDDLFEHFPHDEHGEYYRYTMELHSETIDPYGNWCGVKIYDEKIGNVKNNIDLALSEPRMLVNLSICYYADDSKSQSDSYRQSVRNMLNEYSHRMAESTDGHVLIDKVLLFSTDNRLNFYDTENIAAMADIRIETEESDDGVLWSNVQIHSNAHPTGFYSDDTYTAEYDKENGQTEHFTNLKNGDELGGRRSFYRIQMSGTEGAGWDNSMIDEAYAYSTTVMHETGHYLLGFFDEYLNYDGAGWSEVGNKPYTAYGLMDNQHTDIEMSKTSIDYAYMINGFGGSDRSIHTNHSWLNGGSCEDSLATLLTDSDATSYYYRSIINSSDYSLGKYKSNYSKVEGTNDHTATYSYAGLEEADFLSLLSESTATAGLENCLTKETLAMMSFSNESYTKEPVGDVSFTTFSDSMVISVVGGNYDLFTVSWRKSDENSFETALHNGATILPIAQGELAEIHVSNGRKYNVYFIDRTENTDVGYIYMSADNAVTAYVANEADDSYSFIADNTDYINGGYISMNQATRISADSGKDFDSGEIYSVASYLAEIDYTTLSWFKYADGKWKMLETDYSQEENMNIGARADLDGQGIYVLMAKTIKDRTALSAENLQYKQSKDSAEKVTLSFDDPNTNSKYYNVYYSDTELTDKNAENVVVRSFRTDSTELTINLIEPNRTVYAAVEIVLKDGRRSELSKIKLTSGNGDKSITRVSGDSRYDTGYKVADIYKEKLGVEKFDSVIVATGKNFADALSGSYLAVVKKAPILLTNGKDENIEELHDYIKKNVKKGGTIYILGGEAAVPSPVEQISGYTTKRLFGSSRYDTNIAVLVEAEITGDEIIVATGKSFADSLSASATKLPVLLLKPDNALNDVQKFVLNGVNKIYIVGGNSAVSEETENELKAYGDVERIYGLSRYETSVAVADKFFTGVESVAIASGKNFPDGLCGGPLAATMSVPLILTKDDDTDTAAGYVAENGIVSGYVLGGYGALSNATVMQVFRLETSDEIILK